MTAAVVILTAGMLVGCSSAPDPTGDPDPGGALLRALKPAATALPGGVRITHSDFVEPKWDSCDATASTYGWDEVTVAVAFKANGLSDQAIIGHIKDTLRSLGWIYDSASEDGAWYWHRDLVWDHRGEIQLLGGAADVDPSWDFQATTPALTHPIGC